LEESKPEKQEALVLLLLMCNAMMMMMMTVKQSSPLPAREATRRYVGQDWDVECIGCISESVFNVNGAHYLLPSDEAT
jgi:hypothetical protein